ncbi:uncharacterized protein G2W53_040134 [Senna tora]|uniref:Uncharacterized protein n=1 Tax=Senna tora TaxID=362788 RepID=A0A834SRN7_9FABA|nr:uncharacterized protein G2W53_040134 [Senna tora]
MSKEEQSGMPGVIGFLSNDHKDIRVDTLLLRPSHLLLRPCFFLEELNPLSPTHPEGA